MSLTNCDWFEETASVLPVSRTPFMAASSSNAELGCCGIAELITIPFQLANRR